MELSYVSGSNFPSTKNKKLTLKKASGATSKAPKTKIYYSSPKKVMNKFFQKHFLIIVSIFFIN